MNRQTILAVIHRQLRESLAETGEVRPLGEIVGTVAEELRVQRNGQVTAGVIRIETVAAFVDGSLSPEESEAVCQAVMVDNSILAELVSAVRSIQQPVESLGPLPDVLRTQLLAMQSSLPTLTLPVASSETPPVASSETPPVAPPEAPQETPSETPPAGLSATVAEVQPVESVDASPIAVEEPAAPRIKTDSAVVHRAASKKLKQTRKMVMALFVVAASLLAAIFFVSRGNRNNAEQPEVAQDAPNVPGPAPDPGAPPLVPSPSHDSGVRIVDVTDQSAAVEPNELPKESAMERVPPDTDGSPLVAQQDPSPKVPDAPAPSIEPIPPRPDSSPAPPPSSLAKATELSGIRWTKITGVVTRANQVGPASASRASRSTTWESVQTGAPPQGVEGDGALTLRTLPLSRAEATLQSGGRVVLAADSSVEVSKPDADVSAEVRLQYGDIALVDLPAGTLIRLIKAGHELATLHWQSRASAVLQHGDEGLQVHVRHGTIDINDRPQKDSSVNIGRNRQIQTIEQPKREPAWVDRPVETINIKQAFLAQIGESRNVMGTLNQQIKSLTQDRRVTDADARTLATLAGWQAALAGDNVYRLASSHTPAVRMAALNRVVTLPRWDPRYQRIWTTIENASRDRQRVARFRRLAFLAQQNGAPSAAQINAMLEDLTAPDVASRAMSDYLLRRFHRNNAARRLPTYDPTWTGQTQTRGVNQWRSYLGRAANGAALAPAAARP